MFEVNNRFFHYMFFFCSAFAGSWWFCSFPSPWALGRHSNDRLSIPTYMYNYGVFACKGLPGGGHLPICIGNHTVLSSIWN